MLDELCACVAQWMRHPSVAEVLERLRTDQVCTATQCYDSLDALVPMAAPPASAPSPETLLLLLWGCAMILLLGASRPPLSKPWRLASRHESQRRP